MNDNWAKDSVFYHIYPLGLCGAEHENDAGKQVVFNLEKIHEWIPYLKDLGVNGLYLGPLFESESHGYDTIDYFKVDRRLGDNESLKKLINELHNNGIRVVFDGVFHHVGRSFFAFSDLRKNAGNSTYKDWFVNVNFNNRSSYNDPFSYDGWNGYYSLVKLNLGNHDVKQHIFSAVKFWADEFKIDGIRLDAADYMDVNFLAELSDFCRKAGTDLWLMGEVIHGDYRKWVNDKTLDSVTNYECYKGLWSSHNDNNYFEIAYTLNRQFGEGGMYRNLFLYNFTDNHDVDRVMTSLKNPMHAFPLYMMFFTIPGIPSIYYGSEWGVKGKKGKYDDYDLRPEMNIGQLTGGANNGDLYNTIKKLIGLRKNHVSLRHGSYRQIFLNHNQIVFLRETANERIIIAINSDGKKVPVEFSLPFQCNGLFDVLNNEEFLPVSGKFKVDLYSNWGRIMVVK
jgi:cyclomaltodextrinase / maltogenic alpha-amylase / neopullulanase